MKIIGNTVGTTTPKPNLMQVDPKKGDFVKGKEEFIAAVIGVFTTCINDTFVPLTQSEYDALVSAGTVDENVYYLISSDDS